MLLKDVDNPPQPIYQSLLPISLPFMHALYHDLKQFTGDDSKLSCLSLLYYTGNLRTVAGVFVLLGRRDFASCMKIDKLKAYVSSLSIEERPVFVLDEAIPFGADQSIESERSRMLQFARNLLRAVGLVVVLMGTDSTAGNMITVGVHNRGPDVPTLWCKLVVDLPKWTNNTDVAGVIELLNRIRNHHTVLQPLCSVLEEQCTQCLPWFVVLLRSALQSLCQEDDENQTMAATAGSSGRDWSIPSVMDFIFCNIAKAVFVAKYGLVKRGGVRGQFVMHLNMDRSHPGHHDATDDESYIVTLCKNSDRFVVDHFAKLEGDNVDLELVSGRPLCVRNAERWNPTGVYPTATGDSFLYLTLGGGKKEVLGVGSFPHPFQWSNSDGDVKMLTSHSALEKIITTDPSRGGSVDLSNRHAQSRLGEKLDAIASVAMEVASHQNGVGGILLNDFILSLVEELSLYEGRSKLQLTWDESTNTNLIPQGAFATLKVPFMSSSNDEWPQSLYNLDDCCFGNLERTKHLEHVDFVVHQLVGSSVTTSISGEAQCRIDAIDSNIVYDCLTRIIPTVKVHFIFAGSLLTTSYFDKKRKENVGGWPTLVQDEFSDVNVLRVSVDNANKTLHLKRLSTKHLWVPWDQCRLLVIVIGVEELKFEEA